MATSDKEALNTDRAVRFARLFSQRKLLEPPIDIMAAVSEVAIVEFDNIPTKCAALLVRNTGRPRIIVSAQLGERQWRHRLRFTLAHELAHLVLPWQIGTFFCHPDESVAFSDHLTRMMEGEANRFASELLVPQSWLRVRAESYKGNPSEFVANTMRVADVSAPTALFASIGVLSSGCTLAIIGADLVVQYIESTAGSFWNAPRPGDRFPYDQVSAASGNISYTNINDRTIISVQFHKLDAPLRPSTSASDLLKAIVLDLGLVGTQRQQAFGAVNGVVGALNGFFPQLTTAGEFLGALKQRFLGRPELAAIIEHPTFGDFLLAKAHELTAKRTLIK